MEYEYNTRIQLYKIESIERSYIQGANRCVYKKDHTVGSRLLSCLKRKSEARLLCAVKLTSTDLNKTREFKVSSVRNKGKNGCVWGCGRCEAISKRGMVCRCRRSKKGK